MRQLTVYLDTSHLRDFRSNDRTDVADWLGVDVRRKTARTTTSTFTRNRALSVDSWSWRRRSNR